MSDKEKTVIEKYCINGMVNPIEFATASHTYGVSPWREEDTISALRKAAMCETKEDREFMLSLIDRVSIISKDSDELRLRFKTIKSALEDINGSLKKQGNKHVI